MNNFITSSNPKTNASLQVLLMTAAGVWLLILLFSNYKSWDQEYNGDKLSCKLKYDGNIRCKLNGHTLFKNKITSSDCSAEYECNTILATYPITIIDVIFIATAIVMSVLKQSALPGKTIIFNNITLVLISLSGLSLLILSIILLSSSKNSHLSAWVLVSQLLIAILLFASTAFIRKEEKLSEQIRRQELLTETEIRNYVVQ